MSEEAIHLQKIMTVKIYKSVLSRWEEEHDRMYDRDGMNAAHFDVMYSTGGYVHLCALYLHP